MKSSDQGMLQIVYQGAWRSDFKAKQIFKWLFDKTSCDQGAFIECNQEIMVKFCQSKILISVTDSYTVLMRVTTH